MIIFRPREERSDARVLAADLLRRVQSTPAPGHEEVTEWLIDAGVLECALADHGHAERDGDDPLQHAAALVTQVAGAAQVASWYGESVRSLRTKLERALVALQKRALPASVVTRIPEGFLFYGLYPESWIAAAERFAREKRPAHAICLGLRSIGASLSAVVAATLERRGCRVVRRTLRPRGPAGNRRVELDADLAETLRSRRHGWFLLIDEGPGLTGNSMTAAAEALSGIGIADERIVFFPSWIPDPASFASEQARARWPRHAAYVGSFEEEWIDSGKLARALGLQSLGDVSAGRWRPLLYRDGRPVPAVHPGHERLKFVGVRNGETILAKFVGLGRCGRVKKERAERLAAAGFAPEVVGFAHGFLAMKFVAGEPANAPPASPELLGTMGRYLGFLRREFPVESGTPLALIAAMARENVAEGLGTRWAERLEGLERLEKIRLTPVRLDGRMMPQEWLRTAAGWRKTDATDHHDDHFFPGCSDIAWDVAAVCEEFALGPAAEGDLVRHVQELTRDRALAKRVPLFRVAYLAYRFGYASTAARAVGPPDAPGWQALATQYRGRLRQAIEAID